MRISDWSSDVCSSDLLNFVGGAVVVLFGLLLIGLLRPTLFMREFRFHAALPRGRPFSAYVLGLAFAFGWTPCIGPILGAILTVGAASATVTGGVALLAIYRSEEHTSELQSLMRISYAVFCFKKQKKKT